MSALPIAGDPDGQELTYLARQHKHRAAAFWHITAGELISERGAGSQLGAVWPLSRMLDMFATLPTASRPRVLFLIGGESATTTPRRSWWAEPAAAGWQYDGYEIAAHADGDPVENAGTYSRDGIVIDVRMSAIWFPGVTVARVARDAWLTLQLALHRSFDAHATPLTTPAMTGLDLLQRSLPRGVRYPLAPAELRELLHQISGQGRFEFCPDPSRAGRQIDGLYTLDARWMYAACVRNLPTGIPHHTAYSGGADAAEAFAGYAPAWYRVNIQVPRNWIHRGLIGQRIDGETIWPCEPGQWIRDVWTTGAELAVALRQRWPCLIYERWAYPTAGPYARILPDPTREWIGQLRSLRETYAGDAPVAAAIRAMMIDTVGMWHRTAGEKLRITPIAQFPGAASGARLHHVDRRAGLAYWYEPKPLARDQLAWQRPEWSTTTWSRARSRENDAALRIPRDELVAYRSDGLVTCVAPDPAEWPDDGKPGTFRRKGAVIGPLVMPASAAAMQELRRESEAL